MIIIYHYYYANYYYYYKDKEVKDGNTYEADECGSRFMLLRFCS